MVGVDGLARRIEAYREQAGLNQADLAAEIGVDRTALSKIESGSRKVSALELHALARALGVRLEWFFDEPPPAVVAYRKSSSGQRLSNIDATLERLSREIQFVCSIDSPEWAPLQAKRVEPSELNPEVLASRTRAAANIGNDPIRSMSDFTSKIGVLTFSIDLGPNSPDGASSPVGTVGVAVINGQRDVGRRRLTAAHEIGHLLCGDQYEVDWRIDQPDQDAWENKLDQFARALLLPEKPLRSSWSRFGETDFEERSQALRDASHWQVDMSTLARRLQHLSLVDHAAADRIRHYRHSRSDFDELDLVNRSDLDPVTLPKTYTRSVLKLYRKEDLSADRAVDLLMGAYAESDLPALEPLPENSFWSLL